MIAVLTIIAALFLHLRYAISSAMSGASSSAQVLVVGSVNADVIIPVDKMPEQGETILAKQTPDCGTVLAGGKGANQAVSSSLLNAKTSLCTHFGDDNNGKMLSTVLRSKNVNLSMSKVIEGKPNGLGLVFLREAGEVSAIVAPNANREWSQDEKEYIEILSQCTSDNTAVIMLQCEVPAHVNEYIAKIANQKGIRVFQDIGGEDRPMSKAHLSNCDMVSPNETELKRMTNLATDSIEEVIAAAKTLQSNGANHVLVTLGSKGSVLITKEGEIIHGDVVPVETVVDETGAGDTFRAAFCVRHYVERKTLNESLAFAGAASAICVSRLGAIPACATRAEVNAVLIEKQSVANVVENAKKREQAITDAVSDTESHHQRTMSRTPTTNWRQRMLGGGKKGDSSSDTFPFKFASRLNSFRDREAVLGIPSSGVLGWIQQAGRCKGLDYIDLNYPQHFVDFIPTDAERSSFLPPEAVQEKAVLTLHSALREANLRCGALCLRYPRQMQGGGLTNADPVKRQQAIRLTKEACEWALALGAREVVIWSAYDGYDYPLQVDYDVLWERVVMAFQEVCDEYPQLKISLEFKPTDENTRFFAVPSTGSARVLVNHVDRDNFGLTLDFGHLIMAGENPGQSVAFIGSTMNSEKNKLFGVQLGDGYNRIGDEDGLAFGSVHRLAALEFIVWLIRTGYDGHIYFDTFPRNEDPQRECEYNIRTFKRLHKLASRLLNEQEHKLEQIWNRHDGMELLELLEKEDF